MDSTDQNITSADLCRQLFKWESAAIDAYSRMRLGLTRSQVLNRLSAIQASHEKSALELDHVLRVNLGVVPPDDISHFSFPVKLRAGERSMLELYRTTVSNGILIPDIRNFLTTNVIPRIETNIRILDRISHRELLHAFHAIMDIDKPVIRKAS